MASLLAVDGGVNVTIGIDIDYQGNFYGRQYGHTGIANIANIASIPRYCHIAIVLRNSSLGGASPEKPKNQRKAELKKRALVDSSWYNPTLR